MVGDVSRLKISLREGQFHVECNGVDWIHGAGVALPIAGQWLRSDDGTLMPGRTEEVDGRDLLGEYSGWSVIYCDQERAIVRLTIKAYRVLASVLFEAEALEDLEGTFVADSFVQTTFQAPILKLTDTEFLLYTWGLTDQGRKGDWPHAIHGGGINEIPCNQAFAPLVVSAEGNTAVISPLNHYLLSPMNVVETRDGPAVARGLHGSINKIPRGTRTQTVITFGSDLSGTLLSWGDVLLRVGKKERAHSSDHPVVNMVGYWNDYGSYYAELFSGMNEETLLQLAEYFKREDISIGYFGLDLWYRYDRVGMAKSYASDSERFPSGLRDLHKKTGIPYFLHLSGFDPNNDYASRYPFIDGAGASVPIGKEFYEVLARDVASEGAIGVWQDHLRIYQELIPPLRSSLDTAEEWFSNLTSAFDAAGMPIMLAVDTVGFLLASTEAKSVIAARSGDDYLVKQEKQLGMLKGDAARKYSHVSYQRFIEDRFLVGLLLHALGLYPFHDVFITNAHHPEGFDEPDAEQEALMRALSAGIIGIGDKLGEIDKDVLGKLCFPDGKLAKPDHPPYVLWDGLEDDLIIASTESTRGEHRWIYLSIHNTGNETRDYELDRLDILPAGHLVWDYFRRRVVSRMRGRLAPAGGKYYVLFPLVNHVGLIGFTDKYITAPAQQILALKTDNTGVSIEVSVPKGYEYTFAAYGDGELKAETVGAEILQVEDQGALHLFSIVPTQDAFTLRLFSARSGNDG